jgi:hypothetical protein
MARSVIFQVETTCEILPRLNQAYILTSQQLAGPLTIPGSSPFSIHGSRISILSLLGEIHRCERTMPGVPSYKGCDACRKQKKKVRVGVLMEMNFINENSVIKLNRDARDVKGLIFRASTLANSATSSKSKPSNLETASVSKASTQKMTLRVQVHDLQNRLFLSPKL